MKYFTVFTLAVIVAAILMTNAQERRVNKLGVSKGQRKQSGNGSYFGKRSDPGK